MTRRPLTALLVAATLGLGACSAATTADTTADTGGPATTTGASSDGGTVTVLAAASLTKPFTALAEAYERANPGVDVALSFGSSTTLAQQIAEGAPADVFASAGTAALDQLPQNVASDGGEATIARNTLEIATPPDDPGGVATLADLARPDLDVVLCAASVPCGKAADELLGKAGVTPNVVSREVDVSATLSKVSLGEADAAIVYHSDVVSAGDDVRGVEIPAADNVTLAYPLVWFSSDPDVVGFARYVSGPDGLAVLQEAGFLAP